MFQPIRISFDTSHHYADRLFDVLADIDGLGRLENDEFGVLHFAISGTDPCLLEISVRDVDTQQAHCMHIPFETCHYPHIKSIVCALCLSFTKKALIGVDIDDLIWLISAGQSDEYYLCGVDDLAGKRCGGTVLQVVCSNLDAMDFLATVNTVEDWMGEETQRVVIAVDLPFETPDCSYVLCAKDAVCQSNFKDIA